MKPKLTIKKVKANTVGEALSQYKNLASLEDLQYIQSHPDEFPEFKDDNWYYGAPGDRLAPSLYWNGRRFSVYWLDLRDDWYSYDRVVLRDLPVELESAPELGNLNLVLEKISVIEKELEELKKLITNV